MRSIYTARAGDCHANAGDDIWHDLTAFEPACASPPRGLPPRPRLHRIELGQGRSQHAPRRKRADLLLVERGLFESRARAQAAIEAGLVTANDKPVVKPSEGIPADAVLQAQPAHPFVSRGGVKLTGALEQYPIEIEDHVCLDIGASTGGFTEVLLANGASLVFAIDVGRGQLHPSLHGHPKIVSMEATDIRTLEGKRLPMRPDIVVIDVSFISLKAVLPVALSLAAAPMHLLALIKPQFEAAAKTFQARHHPRCRGASGHLRRHRGFRGVAGMHGDPDISVIDHRRRRQYRILHRRAPWLNAPRHRSCRSPWRRRRLCRRTGRVCAVHAWRRDRRGGSCAGSPSRPSAPAAGRARQPGADRAILPAFWNLRRLRHPALGGRALPRLEARRW
jgi:23S rRNA (cytidine1920-2'-O)/16S rRNA (cytidine1409-2'-O)-methyltransferase